MEKNLNEINSFQNSWFGGYKSGYSLKRNQKGVENYLKENLYGNNILEIGCGGGQWSKFIYSLNIFKNIHCVDILSAEHNNFWEFVGEESKDLINYHHVSDFKLNTISDNSLDFVFSYDVFCHLSLSSVELYLKSLFKKCKKNSKLMIMYADPEKYLKSEPENKYHVKKYLPQKKFIYNLSNKKLINDALSDADGKPSDPNFEPRWYWIGMKNFINLVEKNGFKIINMDLDIDKTNPITLFEKC